MVTWRAGLGPCSWRRAPCPLERDFFACAFGGAPPRGRKYRLGESCICACSRHHFHRRGVCQCPGEGGGLSLLCKAQRSLQVVYLSLHGSFVVPFLGHVATHASVTSAGLRGIHAPLPKPSFLLVPAMLRVWEVTLLLGSSWLRLMGACSMGA